MIVRNTSDSSKRLKFAGVFERFEERSAEGIRKVNDALFAVTEADPDVVAVNILRTDTFQHGKSLQRGNLFQGLVPRSKLPILKEAFFVKEIPLHEGIQRSTRPETSAQRSRYGATPTEQRSTSLPFPPSAGRALTSGQPSIK